MDTDRIIAEKFMGLHPFKAAQVMERMSVEEMASLLGETAPKVVAPVLNVLNAHLAASSLLLIPVETACRLIELMDPLSAQTLLRQLDLPFQGKILAGLPSRLSGTLKRNLEQQSGTVGALMLPANLVFLQSMTVKECIGLMKKNKEEELHPLLVVEQKGGLKGQVPLKSLACADRSLPLERIMVTEVPSLFADLTVSAVLDHPGWQRFPALPVTDRSNLLVGVLPLEIAQKAGMKRPLFNKDLLETTTALGELYRIGLTGFLQSVNRQT